MNQTMISRTHSNKETLFPFFPNPNSIVKHVYTLDRLRHVWFSHINFTFMIRHTRSNHTNLPDFAT